MTTPTTPDHGSAEREGTRGRYTLCRLPVAVYEWLRLTAFHERRSMQSIAVEAITAYRVEWETSHAMREGLPREGGAAVKYLLRLDDDLYEWLRTTAFHARTSINALIVAALTRAHAAQTEGVAGS